MVHYNDIVHSTKTTRIKLPQTETSNIHHTRVLRASYGCFVSSLQKGDHDISRVHWKSHLSFKKAVLNLKQIKVIIQGRYSRFCLCRWCIQLAAPSDFTPGDRISKGGRATLSPSRAQSTRAVIVYMLMCCDDEAGCRRYTGEQSSTSHQDELRLET